MILFMYQLQYACDVMWWCLETDSFQRHANYYSTAVMAVVVLDA